MLPAAVYLPGTLRLVPHYHNADSRRALQPALLRALLLASLGPLTRLEVMSCQLEAAPPVCPQLASLAALRLSDCYSRRQGEPVSKAALAGLLLQARNWQTHCK